MTIKDQIIRKAYDYHCEMITWEAFCEFVENQFKKEEMEDKIFQSITFKQAGKSNKMFVVYPDSVKIDLAYKNKPVAWFIHEEHAHKFGQLMWAGFYIVKHEYV